MRNLLAELFKTPSPTPAGVHPREALTPGHLYRLMSAEFRAFRSMRCSCVMPLIFTRTRVRGYACNWSVRPLGTDCPSCQPLVDEIVARHAAVYDVDDPTYLGGEGGSEEEPGARFPLFS